MNYPHSIPLWRTSGELLPGNAPYRIVLSSVSAKWNDVMVEERHFPSSERADVMYKRHVIANRPYTSPHCYGIAGRNPDRRCP
jgi:hypothetical protein